MVPLAFYRDIADDILQGVFYLTERITDRINESLVEECEMHIVGHKIFVRLKDIPMYLSKKTKDSIRNRYSHSVEVGLGTEYILNHVSRQLGNDVI